MYTYVCTVCMCDFVYYACTAPVHTYVRRVLGTYLVIDLHTYSDS